MLVLGVGPPQCPVSSPGPWQSFFPKQLVELLMEFVLVVTDYRCHICPLTDITLKLLNY
jgi:hypothetical protein